MKRVLMLVTAVSLVPAPWVAAEAPKEGHRAGPGTDTDDVPRLLIEALRTGTADAEAAGAILSWVLQEKEEKVAAGLVEVFKSVDPPASGPQAARWNPAARSIIAVFEGLLRDAQAHRRRDGDAVARDLVGAAAPAVADALREADPAARERLLGTLRTFAPASRDIVPLLAQALRHGEPAVRLGAATALGALGPAARAALPDLRSVLEDPDTEVREAAAQALKRIEGE